MDSLIEMIDTILATTTVSMAVRLKYQLLLSKRECGSDVDEEMRTFCETCILPLVDQPSTTTEVDEKEFEGWLYDQSSFFEEYPDILSFNQNQPTKAIIGQVQSGKSAVICGVATHSVIVNHVTTLIIVRDLLCDYKQILNKFLPDGQFGGWNVPLVYAGDKDSQELMMALNNTTPSIILCLANSSQVKCINRVLEKMQTSTFDVIVDEADDLGYKKHSSKPYIQAFNQLRTKCRQLYLVTATAYTLMFQEYQLANDEIYFLNPSDNYKGLDSVEMVATDFRWFVQRNGEYRFSDGFLNHLQDLEEEQFIEQLRIDDDYYNHPVIQIQKGSPYQKYHNATIREFATHPQLNEVWTCITYNGEGIQLYSATLRDLTIGDVRGSEPSEPSLRNLGILSFPGVTIQQGLQSLRDLDPNAETFTHIHIVTGRLGSRGTNFVSQDYHWHLTHQLLDLSKTSSAADLVQSIRLFGCYNDDVPLRLFTSQKDINDLRLSYKIQEDLLSGAMDIDEIVKVVNVVPHIEVLAKEVPKRKLCKKSKYTLNKVTEQEFTRLGHRESREHECKDQMGKDSGIGQIIRYFICHEPMELDEFKQSCQSLFGIKYDHRMFGRGRYSNFGPFLVKTNLGVTIHEDYTNFS